MAITKTHPIKSTLKAAIDYICNPVKMDGKIQNLKLAAKAMNFLTEHGIEFYSELESKLDTLTNQRDIALSKIKEIEHRTTELNLVMKHAATYRQLKPMYDLYRQSKNKGKFVWGHKSEIILYEVAVRELKRMEAVPLPSTERIKTEFTELHCQKSG